MFHIRYRITEPRDEILSDPIDQITDVYGCFEIISGENRYGYWEEDRSLDGKVTGEWLIAWFDSLLKAVDLLVSGEVTAAVKDPDAARTYLLHACTCNTLFLQAAKGIAPRKGDGLVTTRIPNPIEPIWEEPEIMPRYFYFEAVIRRAGEFLADLRALVPEIAENRAVRALAKQLAQTDAAVAASIPSSVTWNRDEILSRLTDHAYTPRFSFTGVNLLGEPGKDLRFVRYQSVKNPDDWRHFDAAAYDGRNEVTESYTVHTEKQSTLEQILRSQAEAPYGNRWKRAGRVTLTGNAQTLTAQIALASPVDLLLTELTAREDVRVLREEEPDKTRLHLRGKEAWQSITVEITADREHPFTLTTPLVPKEPYHASDPLDLCSHLHALLGAEALQAAILDREGKPVWYWTLYGETAETLASAEQVRMRLSGILADPCDEEERALYDAIRSDPDETYTVRTWSWEKQYCYAGPALGALRHLEALELTRTPENTVCRCPLCGEEGTVIAATHRFGGGLYFVCDDCLAVYASREDAAAGRSLPHENVRALWESHGVGKFNAFVGADDELLREK